MLFQTTDPTQPAQSSPYQSAPAAQTYTGAVSPRNGTMSQWNNAPQWVKDNLSGTPGYPTQGSGGSVGAPVGGVPTGGSTTTQMAGPNGPWAGMGSQIGTNATNLMNGGNQILNTAMDPQLA